MNCKVVGFLLKKWLKTFYQRLNIMKRNNWKEKSGWLFYMKGMNDMKNSKWNFRILFAHCITIVLWGSAFPGIRVGLEAYTPEHLTLLRLLIASFALFILAIISKMRLPELKDIPVIFILGGLGFTVYHIALNYGEQSVSAGPASLIVSVTTPIFTAILACIFFREKFKL